MKIKDSERCLFCNAKVDEDNVLCDKCHAEYIESGKLEMLKQRKDDIKEMVNKDMVFESYNPPSYISGDPDYNLHRFWVTLLIHLMDARREQGITREDMAIKLKRNIARLERFECNSNAKMDWELAFEYADALGLKLDIVSSNYSE